MRNVMESHLSWLALLVTAFYSLLASCRGEDCGQEELIRCARPLEKITNNNALDFGTSKEELDKSCPDLEAGMKCIKDYSQRCMKEKAREHFRSMYTGVNKAIKELCQDGSFQDDFLRHAPCMQKVQAEYELCTKKFQRTTHEIESAFARQTGSQAGGQNGPLKSICCAFKEYLSCSHHTVRRTCGEETAKFMKDFLDRMSHSLIKVSCESFTEEVCDSSSATSGLKVRTLAPLMLTVILARYFT